MRIKDIILHQLVLSKRQIITYFLGMTLCFASIPTVLSTVFDYGNPVNYTASTAMPIVALLCGILLGAVNLFKPFEKKSSGIQYAMLPANNMEKYLSGMLFYTFGTLLMIVIAVVCADGIQTLYNLAMSNDVDSMTMETFSKLKTAFLYDGDGNPCDWGGILCKVMFLLIYHSVYTLVGSFYRKHAFLKSFITVNAATLALIFIPVVIVACLNKYLQGTLTVHFLISFDFIGNLICYAFIAFCYWKSYRRFCRRTIV